MAEPSPVRESQAPERPPIWKRVWAWAKGPWDIIKVCKTLASVATAGVAVFTATATTSNILRGFILCFGVLGGLAGYFLTVGLWKDTARYIRRWLGTAFMAGWFVTILALVMVLTAMDASVAREYSLISSFHDVMVDFILATDFVVGLITLFNFYFLVASFTVLLPAMNKGA